MNNIRDSISRGKSILVEVLPPRGPNIDKFMKYCLKLKEIGIKTLPSSLDKSIKKFSKSKLMKELMGEELFNNYIKAKKLECAKFRNAVTDWEIDRYLKKC